MRLLMKTLVASAASACLLLGAQAQQDGSSIDFGDDEGLWVFDGECDDPRFEGPGMADSLDDDDSFHDATDCQTAFEAGTVTLAENTLAAPLLNAMPDRRPSASNDMEVSVGRSVDFGDDDSFWANDGECDDARFIGEGMTDTDLVREDIGHDASDCQAAFEAGDLRLRGEDDPSAESVLASSETQGTPDAVTSPAASSYGPAPEDGLVFNGVNFGDDEGDWANDGECDDPRFTGQGMTETTLLAEDAYHDASDCLAAWKTGGLALSED